MDPIFGSTAPLNGLRSTLGGILNQAPQGFIIGVMVIFLILLFRALLRNQWAAGAAFALLFGFLQFLQNGNSWMALATAALLNGLIAFVMLRYGLLAGCIGIFLSNTELSAPLTTNASSWFFVNVWIAPALMVAFTLWGAWTSLGGRKIFKADLFE